MKRKEEIYCNNCYSINIRKVKYYDKLWPEKIIFKCWCCGNIIEYGSYDPTDR
jgi:hypothetical protein